MTEIDQCVIIMKPGCPFTVRHSRSCISDYCQADYQAEQSNRARLRRVEMELEAK